MEPRRSSRPGGRGGGPPAWKTWSGCARTWSRRPGASHSSRPAMGTVGAGPGGRGCRARRSAGGGVGGPLPPRVEEELAEALSRHIPWIEAVRFFKTSAEAVAAAVRLARVTTGRELVLGCGYHGWLDWCQGGGVGGVPAATRALYAELPFNDAERSRQQIREAGDGLAVVVVEPVVVEEPRREWLAGLRGETGGVGGGVGFGEIKNAVPPAGGGGGGRLGGQPRLRGPR